MDLPYNINRPTKGSPSMKNHNPDFLQNRTNKRKCLVWALDGSLLHVLTEGAPKRKRPRLRTLVGCVGLPLTSVKTKGHGLKVAHTPTGIPYSDRRLVNCTLPLGWLLGGCLVTPNKRKGTFLPSTHGLMIETLPQLLTVLLSLLVDTPCESFIDT